MNEMNVLFSFKEVFTMLDDYEEIKLIGFSEEAARLIQRKMNEQQPESVPEHGGNVRLSVSQTMM